jgi:hypothetical protein
MGQIQIADLSDGSMQVGLQKLDDLFAKSLVVKDQSADVTLASIIDD